MNHSLPWIILFSPLVSALLILLVTRRQGYLSAYLSIAAVAVSFLASCALLGTANHNPHFPWIDFSPDLLMNFGVAVTDLSKTMLIVVTLVGLLVHVYSLGYMQEDRDIARYYAGLSLFMFSMLGIVLADNFVMMFIFWELVGVSSYLLIGHWYERPQAADAANKAFLVNRIGDFGFMAGILMLWSITGQIDFSQLAATINESVKEPAFQTHFVPYLTVAMLLIFCGPMGKSAQVPLHVWLPDAMEGPTPVSALIHAATMVAAGVYLLVRVSFLLAYVPIAQEVIAIVGITTAVLAALMATQQNDIKRILAYSTLSQLGYMVSAVGVAAGGAAMFHLFTHAFFKALLFLGAGAVIHALHHEQDIWKMGGLRTRMPVTFWTFLIATLALMGCPFLSGFYSKDAIIEAMAKTHPVIAILGLLVAFLTAFYMGAAFRGGVPEPRNFQGCRARARGTRRDVMAIDDPGRAGSCRRLHRIPGNRGCLRSVRAGFRSQRRRSRGRSSPCHRPVVFTGSDHRAHCFPARCNRRIYAVPRTDRRPHPREAPAPQVLFRRVLRVVSSCHARRACQCLRVF